MQAIFWLLIFFTLSSCATREFRFVYSCYTPDTYANVKARLCYEKENSSKYGLAYPKGEKWYFKPKYDNVVSINGDLYLQKNKDDTFVKTNIHLENKKETDFIAFFHTRNDQNNKYKRHYFVTKNDEIVFISKMDKKIKNADRKYLATEHGATKYPVYSGLYDGYIIRHRVDNETYYTFYDNKLEIVKDKIPVDEIKFWYNSQYEDRQIGFVIPMIQVNKERDLYWPLVLAGKKMMEKPDHVLGIENTSTRTWLEPDFNIGARPIASRMIGITDLYIVFKDKTGKERVAAHKLNIPAGLEFDIFKKIFLEPEKSDVLDDLHKIDSVYVASDGKTYDQKYFIEEKNKKFKVSKYLLREEFNSLDEVTSFFNHYQNNKAEIAKMYKAKYDQNALEVRLRNQEISRSVENERLKLVNKQRAKEAAKRAAIRAESDAAWSNVSNQLKQRAREADQKADCVRGRTKKKQDFLDKKQNWYQDYDC